MLDAPNAKGVAVRMLSGGRLRAAAGQVALVAALTALTALPGCGGDRPGPAGTTGPLSSPSVDGESPPATNGGATGENGGEDASGGNGAGEEEPDEIAWVPPGPAGPDTPPPVRWYASLEDGDCDRLASSTHRERTAIEADDVWRLYYALGQACLATRGGRPELWATAREELRTATDGLAGQDLDCYNQAAFDLASRMSAASADAPPTVRSSAGTESACEWGISRVELPGSGARAQGPVGAETDVVIRGERLVDITEVWFGDRQATSFTEADDTTLLATAPAAESPGSVRVEVRSPAGERVSPPDQTFTYVEEGSPEPETESPDTDTESPESPESPEPESTETTEAP